MKTKIIVLLLLFCTFSGYSQCDLAKKLFEDDLYASKELREYTSKADDPDKVFYAWRLLHDDKLPSKIDPTILKEVENNYQTIKNAGGYMKWKAVNRAGSFAEYIKNGFKINTSILDDAFKHVDDITLNGAGKPTFNGNKIVGCHNEVNFNAQKVSNGGSI